MTTMKRVSLRILACLMTMFVLVGCSQTDRLSSDTSEEGLDIVTSFYPVYQITKEVAGDLNNVRMIQSGSGIHGFEPSAQDVAAIQSSDVFVYHSEILESWAKRLEETLDDSVVVIEGSKGLDLKRVQGLEDVEASEELDEHKLYDPHSWLDPVLVADETQRIAQALSELDPEHAEVYQSNEQAIREKADQLVDEYTTKFQPLEQKTFVTQHTAFAYLADRFGLTQLGIAGIDAESEPNPKQMKEVEAFIREYQVGTIFVEPNVSEQSARALSAETGAEIVTLSPLETDPKNTDSYFDNLSQQLNILYKALRKDN